MKTLTKVKIINWHYFWNETIEIKPISFLTGPNASGKSTFLDALQVILLGDTSGRYFNKAAQEKSNRTLKGYLKGELGDTEDGGFRYLREGRFSSYIVGEYFDDINNVYFLMGIVFDLFEDGSEEHKFFTLDSSIPSNEFILNNIPMSYKTLLNYFEENYKNKFKFFDSNKAYTEFLKKKFGGLKDKYFSLLKKATSFIPITDITTFITEYVCDPVANIKLDEMQENIFQYKHLEAEANLMNIRITKLQEISSLYQKYNECIKNSTLFSYMIEKSQVELSNDRIKNYEKQILSHKKRLTELEQELAENEMDTGNLRKRKLDLMQDRATCDVYRITEELYKEKERLEKKIKELEQSYNSVRTNLLNYSNTYVAVSESLKTSFSKIDLDSLNEDRANDIIELNQYLDVVLKKSQSLILSLNDGFKFIDANVLNEWKESLFSFKQILSAFCVSFARNIRYLEETNRNLKEQQQSLNNGVKAYDNNLTSIKRELKDILSKRFNQDVDVEFFADLIDIKDKKWINACEGFLSNQKFNLFVAPKFYNEAYRVLKDLLAKYHFYGTSLVDSEKLIEKGFSANKNSLAEEILSEHEGAIYYSNYLIGRLMKCNTPQEARESLNGITPECDLYRNFALSKINPRLYQRSFIGRSIGARLLQEAKENIASNSIMIGSYKELYSIINEANALEIINSNEINNMIEDINSTYELPGLNKSLKICEEELSRHDTITIDSLDKRIETVEEDIISLENRYKGLLEEKANIRASIKLINEEKIVDEKNILDKKIENINNNYDSDFVSQEGFTKYLEESQSKKPLEIINEYQSLVSRSQYLSSNLFNQVKKIRKEYVDDYHSSLGIDEQSNEKFEEELIILRDVKLPEYQDKIADSYKKATKQFKDDFISKLKNQIETVEDQINELNQALMNSVFGNDSYRFTCKCSTTYKRYYDMFKDELLLKMDEDDSEFLEKYGDVMNDLFQQIISSSDAKSSEVLAGIEKFTDYRSYLDFDLIVTNKDGVEQRLSKMIKKKSGGETQTPFYISVLASFAQLYHVKDSGELSNTIRLIVFDEAFSKMDRNRIKESIKLLRKFNLQAILSAPSEKVADISELVDETLVVLRSKNSSSIRIYSKEK